MVSLRPFAELADADREALAAQARELLAFQAPDARSSSVSLLG